jgi:hypothetical protein
LLADEIPRMNRGMTVRSGMTVCGGMTIISSSRYVLAGSAEIPRRYEVELALATFMTPFAVFKNECFYNCTSCALLNILLKNLISYYTRDKQFINDERLQKGA